MAPTNTNIDPRREDIIESLASLVSSYKDEVVMLTCVDEEGNLGETEAYASNNQPKSSLPLEVVLTFPESRGVDTVMVTSRAAASFESIADSDIAFTRALIDAADARGIEVLDHILVHDGEHQGLRAITEIWN
jgi:DNA repair protein RadC